MTDALWSWTASDLAAAIRARAISATEAVRSCQERMEQVNGQLNAIVEADAEAALAAAAHADAAVREGERLGPLHGVPVAFKTNTNQRGFANTNGVAALRDAQSPEDDPQVASWLAAGAISIGRTNCPPFSTRWTTESELYGATVNPWDASVTPGGSSGGAAAALAAGIVPLAQGNDIGGSIRYPAACCGVTGIRPTLGRLPGWYGPVDADPGLAVQSFLVQGPLARTVEDLRLGYAAMLAPDPRDPVAVPAHEHFAPLERPLRVALVADPGGAGLTAPPVAEMREALDTAAGWLSDAGCQVQEIELPQLGEAARLWWEVVLCELDEFLVPEVARVGDAGIQRFFELMFAVYREEFGAVGLRRVFEGYARRGMLRRELQVIMEDFPLILTPISGEPPFPMGDDALSVARVRELMSRQWPSMAVPFVGLPGLGIAVAEHGGAPHGVQLVGRPFREDTLFDAAEVIEARSQVRTPIDPRP